MNASTSRLAVFRVDGGSEIGGGHLARCTVLAAELAEKGWHCIVASRADGEAHSYQGSTSDHEWIWLDDAEVRDAGVLQRRCPDGVDLLIVDHYGLGIDFEQANRAWADMIMSIDDQASRAHDVDLLLDQSVGRRAEEYDGLLAAKCAVLCGPSYAILKKRFAKLRAASPIRRRSIPPKRVLVTLGMADPLQATTHVLDALVNAALKASVDVVVGRFCQEIDAIRAKALRLGARVHVDVDSNDLADLMDQADLAIGAPGVTALEFCCLGVPALLLITAANQRQNAAGLEQLGAAHVLSRDVWMDEAQLDSILVEFFRNESAAADMAKRSMEICDGQGVHRVSAAIENLYG